MFIQEERALITKTMAGNHGFVMNDFVVMDDEEKKVFLQDKLEEIDFLKGKLDDIGRNNDNIIKGLKCISNPEMDDEKEKVILMDELDESERMDMKRSRIDSDIEICEGSDTDYEPRRIV